MAISPKNMAVFDRSTVITLTTLNLCSAVEPKKTKSYFHEEHQALIGGSKHFKFNGSIVYARVIESKRIATFPAIQELHPTLVREYEEFLKEDELYKKAVTTVKNYLSRILIGANDQQDIRNRVPECIARFLPKQALEYDKLPYTAPENEDPGFSLWIQESWLKQEEEVMAIAALHLLRD